MNLGRLGHNPDTMRLTVQLYTLRQPMADDLTGTLKSIKDMGLEYVEPAGYNGLSASEFKAKLDEFGLKVSGAHWGLDALADVEQVSADARLFGCKHVVLPWINSDKYAQGWVEFGKELEPLARAYSDRGFTFSYHNHAFEFDRNEISTFKEMWEQTEDILHAQLDLAWLAVGGEDPIAWINTLGPRASYVHLKEFSGNKESHDAIAGKGVLDWDGILAACEANNVEFGAIEMDHAPEEPIASVRQCVEFFHTKGIR